MIYCSGNIGYSVEKKGVVEGSITDRTVRFQFELFDTRIKKTDGMKQRQVLTNMTHVLEAGGSSLKNVVKVNVFITSMKDFNDMNKAYLEFFEKPLPVSYSSFV